jgi:drug/metabolite transporter (DMT)-like permease
MAQVLAAATLWAINGVVARSLFRRAVDPAHLVQVRMLIGGLALLPVAVARGKGRLPPRVLPAVVAYALVLAAVQLTYFEAIAAAGVAVAIFLQYTSPLLVAAWEAARSRRLPSRSMLVAMALAAAGSALLVLPGGGAQVPARGFAWGIASAMSFAAATIVAGGLRQRGVSATALLSLGLGLGSLAFVPVRGPWQALATISAPDWPYFLYVAILATAVPFTLYASALASISGSLAMLLAMLEPVLAAALAWIALGEALAPVQLVGGALILSAIALAVRAS